MNKKVVYRLNIDHKWMIWEPKKGEYKGKTKYISLVTSWTKDKFLGVPVVLGGYKTSDGSPHCHVKSITLHQYHNNTRPLEDEKIISDLENKFKEYKQSWEERRIVKTAKQLLMEYGVR